MDRIRALGNRELIHWIEDCAAMTEPDRIVLIDGSQEQTEELRATACKSGELIHLNEELMPGCYLHRSDPSDVARVEDRTFICTRSREDAGNINNWMDPSECYARLSRLYRGAMHGRTMYVIPYSMGIVGSPFAKYGIELTDSIYVVLNMLIMTRAGIDVLGAIGESGNFVRGLHAVAQLDPENRYIAHFPEDNTIWSINSAYGGNVLLGKKCFALRIASYLGRHEGWLAEHMLILEVERPDGDKKYICAAFPSACGKTNLAMLVPPEHYTSLGYRVRCLGDDIAWLRRGKDGRLWAINPENGFFGVAPGTSERTNPNALHTVQKNTIFTNVVHDLDKNTVWWEGLDDEPPHNALNWRGESWDPEKYIKSDPKTLGAHPNSRFTAPAEGCPCLSDKFHDPLGVPISAIVFGGRRARLAPLVYESFSWTHGTFVGSSMASETTAAATGKVGVVRRDPMAMRPFVGYDMGDYFAHWLEVGESISDPPRIFHVNWFRTNSEGHFLWRGFGDNMRVLDWILRRCCGEVGARRSEIGYLPYAEDICLEGLDGCTTSDIEELLSIDRKEWLDEAADIRNFYSTVGECVPCELYMELDALEDRLGKK